MLICATFFPGNPHFLWRILNLLTFIHILRDTCCGPIWTSEWKWPFWTGLYILFIYSMIALGRMTSVWSPLPFPDSQVQLAPASQINNLPFFVAANSSLPRNAPLDFDTRWQSQIDSPILYSSRGPSQQLLSSLSFLGLLYTLRAK